MFEVAPNLWLQSFATPWLTGLMLAISFFGYGWFYAALVLVAGFSLRLRRMLGVMLALLLAGLCMHVAKDTFQLPRPAQVDARILDNGRPNTLRQGERDGAVSFLALPSAAAIATQRAAPEPDCGFISGHVAASTALCAALWLFFGIKSWRWRACLIAWPLLMTLSRLYLGRHFLADVTGGLVAGVAAAFAASWLWKANQRRERWLVVLAAALGAASIASPVFDRDTVGKLAGFAITGVMLMRIGYPADDAPVVARLGRVVLAFGLYVLARVLVIRVARLAGWPEDHAASILLAAAATVLVFVGTVLLARRLGWYRTNGPAIPATAS
jgi:membrane-associated phospholipid phosphatase